MAHWIAAVGEFLARLAVDAEELASRFNTGNRLGRVAGIMADLSDPHHGGRSVAKVTFEDGLTLVYKPRSVAPDAHFSSWLEKLDLGGALNPLRGLRCWDRHSYGWVEYIPRAACSTLAQVCAFYWRAGVLLGSVYMANGVDFHCQNLIACGEHPILVDLETLWHPQGHLANRATASDLSILRTGFLPADGSRELKSYQSSALRRDNPPAVPQSTWLTPGGQRVPLEVAAKAIQTDHQPEFEGKFQPASSFVSEVLAGFHWLGDWLRADRQRTNLFEQWLRGLRRCPRRRVIRSSAQYLAVHKRLAAPQNLGTDGPPWRRWIDACGFTAEEVHALQRLDFPCFVQDAWPDERGIRGLEQVFSEENMRLQSDVISRSLLSRSSSEGTPG